MMRIASMQYHTTMNTALQKASGTVATLMQQMATGNRIQVPSDDSITAVRLARLSREEAMLSQYRENIGALQSRLQQNEVYLDGMNKDLMQARDLLVWALDSSSTSEDLNSMVSSLTSLRDSLFYTSNSKDHEGRYIFSGTAVDQPTIQYVPGNAIGSRYVWTGNTGVQDVVVGNGVTQSANVTLPEVAALLNQMESVESQLGASGVNINNPPVRSVVAGGLDEVDVALHAITGKIANLGGAQNIIQTMDDNHANVTLSTRQAQTTLGQLDYADAAVRMNAYQTALAATQKAYGKVSALSLFDTI